MIDKKIDDNCRGFDNELNEFKNSENKIESVLNDLSGILHKVSDLQTIFQENVHLMKIEASDLKIDSKNESTDIQDNFSEYLIEGNQEQHWLELEKQFTNEIVPNLKKDEIYEIENKRYSIVDTNGGKYYGQINKDNQPDGLGKIFFSQEIYCFGRFKLGNHGQGWLINFLGLKHEDFHHTGIDGVGKFYLSDMGTYYGQIQNGEFNGKGD